MPNYRRARVQGGCWFFTVNLLDRKQRLLVDHIAALWEAKGERGPEFVYLLRWPDEPTLEASWAAFMADAEGSRIKAETARQHGKLVGAIQSRVIRLVDYSGAV